MVIGETIEINPSDSEETVSAMPARKSKGVNISSPIEKKRKQEEGPVIKVKEYMELYGKKLKIIHESKHFMLNHTNMCITWLKLHFIIILIFLISLL